MKAVKRENRELRQADEILHEPSACFAAAELTGRMHVCKWTRMDTR